MDTTRTSLFWLTLLAAALFGAGQSPAAAREPVSSFMAEGAPVQAPAGYSAYCFRNLGECVNANSADASTFVLGDKGWDLLDTVNIRVNRSISPMSDERHYHQADYWTIPTDGYGDCEDYALTKRKELIQNGVSQRALRLAVADTKDGSGSMHTVLIVVTDKGDYVLDNLSDYVRPWSDADYGWLERQDEASPSGWAALQDYAAPQLIAANQ